LEIKIRIPICNIITCEEISYTSDNKMYLCNPFTGSLANQIKKFFTYTIIQDMPNGNAIFKIQILGPKGIIIRETEESLVYVEENIIRIKTKWVNIPLRERGLYTLRVMLKCNGMYDEVGCSHMYIV
jgi:hypothetical protein